MNELRVLHTSDLHIGAPFLFLKTRGNEQRAAIREVLARIAQMAREENYHALLIAGDLFDSAFEASETDVSFAIGCCRGAGPLCQVVILPGSHDHYSPGSVFERERSRFEASGNVHVLRPERAVIELPELSLAVHGALPGPAGAGSALAGLAPLTTCRWNICCAHGSVEGATAGVDPREQTLCIDELAPGFDYVALGHWHSYRVVRERGPAIVYSGAPEIIARDQRGAGSVVSILAGADWLRFERRAVGRRKVAELEVDCTGIEAGEELVQKVLRAVPPDKDVILELCLTGLIDTEAVFDPMQSLEALEGSFFSVRLTGHGPGRRISREELLRLSEDTVAGSFVRVMLGRIDRAQGESKELLEEALQVGYQLFRGRNIIG
jgi:exonuclease SbcD